MPSSRAVLDACVLFPAAVRDTLLRAAAAGLYQAYWSDDILEEVRRNLVNSGRATHEQAQRLVGVMERAFPEALVTSYQPLIDRMRNHPKDRHVLATAVACHAQIIVTDNVRDFPAAALAPYALHVYTADTFLLMLFDSNPEQMSAIVVQQTNDLRSPPQTTTDVLGSIAKHAPTFAERVKVYLETS
jgi:predicted nucleic acid-binding protein